MATTTFTDYSTVVVAAWLNDVDFLTYDIFNGLSSVPSSGKFFRSNGTHVVSSTATIPDTFAANSLVYASASNTLAALAPATSSFLTSDGSQVPTWKNAADTRTALDVPSNAEAILDALLTTTGDQIQASAASTPARLPASATVAAHATTMNPWVARIVTLSGSAVTFTDIADAAFVGQEVTLIANAAHVFTDGAVFDVQGGATYTCEAGDQIRLVATAVDAFDVEIIKANGYPVANSVTQTFLGADVALNNNAAYFDGPNTGSIGAAGQKWEITAGMNVADTAGAATMKCRIWDSSTVYAESVVTTAAANFELLATVVAVVTLSGATTFYASVRDMTSNSGKILTTGNAGTANKASWIVARRVS